ncbi:MAG: hypothetical protein R3F60_14840 [bacterium]
MKRTLNTHDFLPWVLLERRHDGVPGWTGHVLDFDLVTIGEDLQDVMNMVMEATNFLVIDDLAERRDPRARKPAPQEYWERLERVKAHGQHLRSDALKQHEEHLSVVVMRLWVMASVCPIMRTPRGETRHALTRLQQGRRERWSRAERAGVAKFDAFVHKHDMKVECGVRKLKPINIPPLARPVLGREHLSTFGVVQLVGGDKARVHIRFQGDSRIVNCSTERRELAEQLGARLYKRLIIHGVRVFDVETLETVSFKITGFEDAPQLADVDDRGGALARLREAAGNDFDYEEYLELNAP